MKHFFILLLAVVTLSTLITAQTATADIYGTVVLSDGSVIPGVAVSLTSDVTGTKTTVSSEEGNFRFVGLPPGKYQLRFELEGFKTVIQKGIRMYVGKNRTINVQMETSPIKEEITIVGQANTIDTRKTEVGINVSGEMLDSLPTARNPWTVLSSISGVMVDRLDIGGADSGQQSNFLAGGTDQYDTTWNVDGANITDPSAIGSAPVYLNVNTFSEIQVTLGANDIKAQTGGVQLNFVTKNTGNRNTGDFHMYVEDDSWEMSQEPTQYMKDNDLIFPGINRLYMYGLNLGGPILKDKLWWFGSWAVQDIDKRTETGTPDTTWLVSGYGKLNFQLGNTAGDFHISYDSKVKKGRPDLAPSQQNDGSLWDQVGPNYLLYGGLTQTVGNLMLNAKVVYTDGGFELNPRGSELNEVTGHEEGNDFVYVLDGPRIENSNFNYFTNRNTINVSLDGNYFLEGALGGDHEIRFGVDYYDGQTTSQYLMPNQRIVYVDRSSPGSEYLGIYPDYIFDVGFQRTSFYLQDTATFGRLTASVGLRYDKEQGEVNPFEQPYFSWYEPGSPHHGERMFASSIPALQSSGYKPDAAWEMISPRISLTYDLTGDGKTVAKLAMGRYMSQSGNDIAGNYIPFRFGFASWTDVNGDETPQYSEVGNMFWDDLFIQTDPVTGLNRMSYSDDYNSSYLDELTVMLERALSDDLAISLTGFYKKKHNLAYDVDSRGESDQIYKGIMADGSLETADNWEQTGTVVVGGQTVPIYEQIETPVGLYYYNLDKSHYRYLALQVALSKKLSNKWMGNFSFTVQDWKRKFYREEILNQNNFDFWNDGAVAPATTGSGLRDIWVNSRWMFKLTGMYQLPWGINVSAFLQAREGYPQPLRSQETMSQGTQYVYLPNKKVGDERLPAMWMLNLGMEKTIQISEGVSATLVIDWYNVTNNQIEQKYGLNIGSDASDLKYNPTMWSQAGLFQFGARVNF